jgi:hypothetical protein
VAGAVGAAGGFWPAQAASDSAAAIRIAADLPRTPMSPSPLFPIPARYDAAWQACQCGHRSQGARQW